MTGYDLYHKLMDLDASILQEDLIVETTIEKEKDMQEFNPISRLKIAGLVLHTFRKKVKENEHQTTRTTPRPTF